MPNNFALGNGKPWSRRQLLKLGLAGAGITGAAGLWQMLNLQSKSIVKVPPFDMSAPDDVTNPMKMLRDFDYGTVKQENGRTIREFQLTAGTSIIKLNSAVCYNIWDLNGRIPGPTLRAKQGDRIRVLFLNNAGHSHSLHFHGIHPAEMDGVRPIRNGSATIYEFDAEAYEVHLYHCHIEPVTRHIAKGLYGMFIIDPPTPRPPADEIVLIMGGYDINDDSHNDYYAFNGLPHYYMHHPISIYQDQLIRLYVLNIIEQVINELLDSANSEYHAAIADGKITAPIEYQDSRGFVFYANDLYKGISSQVAQADPEVHKAIDTSFTELIKVWPAAIPPTKAVKIPNDVTKLVKTIEENSQKVVDKSNA